MSVFRLAGVLVAAMVWAQVNSAAPAVAPNSSAAPDERDHSGQITAASVAPDAAVLTINGLCAQPAPNSSTPPLSNECRTVVTRAQFDELVEALQAEKDSQTWHQLATAYPQLLVMAHEAEQRGVDKEPRFQERLRFARLQILSQELVRQIREEADRVPEKDISDYYRRNSSEFEQVSLERIIIPNRAQQDLHPSGQAAQLRNTPEEAVTAEAELLRTRALQGENFTKLQKTAYEFAGLSGDSEPDPNLGWLRRRGLPLTHASVFDLKPGQVSPVISDATGHYIYKLDAREVAPLDSVKQEISSVLRRQRLQNMIQAIQRPFTTTVNQTYFGAADRKD
ncbi:MAG: peptidylprolyl isomerase [Terriglobales bacterium]